MPRVSINKKKYKVSDLSKWIIGKMYELNMTQSDLSEMLGITQPAVSNRLKKGLFSYADMLILLKELQATDEEILRFMKI